MNHLKLLISRWVIDEGLIQKTVETKLQEHLPDYRTITAEIQRANESW